LMTDPIIGKRFQYQQAEQAYQFIDQHPDETIKTLFYYDSAS
jgi:threonine dehydrogenase-like Zn-dependent dehydrogenase